MRHSFRAAGLGLAVLATCVLTVLPARAVRSDDAKASPLEGVWKQVEQKNGNAQDYTKTPEDVEFLIYVTDGRFVWTVVKEGRLISAAGGKYAIDKDKYTETIEYITNGGVPPTFVGSTFDFTWKIEGNIWHKVGTIKVNDQDYKIDEKWERCE